MKLRQRVIVTSLVCVILTVVVIYKLSQRPSVTEMIRNMPRLNFPGMGDSLVFSGTCASKHVTSDYMVEEMYDEMNFTTNSRKSGGLYVLHEKSQEYKKNSKNGKEPLQIIVVPHSHNDPGWLWTLETYYTVRTRSILTNTVLFLEKFPDFRMIWTETIFLDIWWKESPLDMQNKFKDLVKQGRIEILSGGWVSVDEATTLYSAVIDQLVEGHLWIKEILGVTPNISWSIDPFGYSTSLPYLWYKSGMKDMTILRVHGALKQYMGHRHVMTFNWRQPWDGPGKYDILCHVEPYTLYNIEYSCGPDQEVCATMDFGRRAGLPEDPNQPISIGNGERQAKNLHEYASLIADQYRKKADHYAHDVLLMPHGDDFRYIMDNEFQSNYVNMKKLMDHINSRKDLNIQMRFGTVGEYFSEVHKSIAKRGQPDKSLTGDFFTYTDRDDEYWSGYYTSRPFDKRMIRYLLEVLKTAEMLTTFAVYRAEQQGYAYKNVQNVLKDLQEARRTHGLVQHHDAITGTSAHPTVVDFENRITAAITLLQGVISRDIESLILKGAANTNVNIVPIHVQSKPTSPLEKRVIAVSESGTQVIFTNSYTQRRRDYVSLIVSSPTIQVFDQHDKEVRVQINPCWENQKTIAKAIFEAVFPVDIPAMSFVMFVLKRSQKNSALYSGVRVINGDVNSPLPDIFKPEKTPPSQSEFVIETQQTTVTFSNKGLLKSFCRKDRDQKVCTDARVGWHWYKGVNSNAYCFGTDGTKTGLFDDDVLVRVVSGFYSTSVIINHALLQHTTTVYNTSDVHGKYVYMENVATLITADDRDKELFMELQTSVRNPKMQYYTDSNSFQLISRQTRENYPMAANLFPITSMAVLEDSGTRLTVHVAQPLGVGSFRTGSLEFLIDRVPTSSGKGLEEPVTDNKPTISKFILHFESFNKETTVINDHRARIAHPSLESFLINDFLQHPLLPFVANRKYDVTELSFLKSDFPCDLVIANLKTFISEQKNALGTGLTLHQRAPSCKITHVKPPCSSATTKLRLFDIFTDLKVKDARRMSLTYLHEKEKMSPNSEVRIDSMDLESFSIQW